VDDEEAWFTTKTSHCQPEVPMEDAYMRTPNRTEIKRNAFLFGFIVLFAASLACGLNTGHPAFTPTSPVKSTAKPTDAINAVPTTLTETTEALSKSFPLYTSTTIDPETVSEEDPVRGSFTLRSTAAVSGLVDFYQTTLPTQGWTYRYSDANTIGGVTQFWKKDNLYLSLQFGYDNKGAVVKIKYNYIAANALGGLPVDFSIPDKAELTNTTNTSWDFYVDQDYAKVVAFYTQASVDWGPCSAGGSQGEGDDGGGSSFPPGASPMPAPTQDSRPAKTDCWVLPSQNQVDLYILPHGDATLLHVYLTSLNPSDSGLPADIPIYPGATIQSAAPGTVTFQAGVSFETVKNFYLEKLTAAGWTPDGQPFESTGTIIMNWKKGSQSAMITITSIGTNECFVIISHEGS
jgi:hypothetical protein